MQDTFTTNGTHKLTNSLRGQGAASSIVYVSGTFSTATLTIVYLDNSGTFIALTDGVLAVDNQYLIEHGVGVAIYAQIASADGSTSINISVAGKS